jgi:hypothetical protein
VSKEDPKHGRWILPIVIAGLIGFTYAFVNALPPAPIALSTTTTTTPTTTTIAPTTTTSTTIPAEIRAFLGQVDHFQKVAETLRGDLHDTNDAWERRDVKFKQTLAGFEQVKADAEQLAGDVAATPVPDANGYADLWVAVRSSADALVLAADDVISGLRAKDDGTQRREAVGTFDERTTTFLGTLDAVRKATPGATSETGSTTTSTTAG